MESTNPVPIVPRGAYVLTWSPPTVGDLRPEGFATQLSLYSNGKFAFIGYWRGHELTMAVGTWKAEEDLVLLEGRGLTGFRDSLPYSEDIRKFAQRFSISGNESAPCLLGLDDIGEWSLLSWRGPYCYEGERYMIDLRGAGVPETWEALATEIDRIAG